MPVYTLEDAVTLAQWDVICSYEELQELLGRDPNISQTLSTPKIIGGRMGNKDTKVPDGFKDLQKRIKAGSGRGNTVNV